MLFLQSPSNDPFFNLAAEEYLLKKYPEDVVFLYIDSPSVIVGKHQNTRAEANSTFCRSHGIEIARRISGGGTVYHDHGNLNFAFFVNGTEGKLVDFRKFTAPVMDVLQSLNIPVEFGGRNDLLVQGKKISGNAEHIYRTRTLHHGTLLFDAALDKLGPAITCNGVYTDRAVKSRRSPVMNLKQLLPEWTMENFTRYFTDALLKLIPNAKPHMLSREELLEIHLQAQHRFRSWEWVYAYSPAYTLSRTICFKDKPANVYLRCENGIIAELTITSESLSGELITGCTKLLKGIPLQEDRLENIRIDDPLMNDFLKQLIPELY